MNCIFILGQNPQKNELLDSVFKKDFSVLIRSSSQELLESFSVEVPVLVISDVSLPEETKALLTSMKRLSLFPSVPVLLMVPSGAADASESDEDFLLPGVSDIFEFPFNPVILRRRAENLISEYYCRKNIEAEAVKRSKYDMLLKNEKLAVTETIIDNFIEVAVNNEFLVGTHAARMRKCTCVFLQEYSALFPEEDLSAKKIEDIAYASVFHDMGKLLVPKDLLLKASALTEAEIEAVRQHTVFGVRFLRGIPLVHQKSLYRLCQDICCHHHERWNGDGYPENLKGDEISIAAQTVGLVEAYVALQEMRPYRKAFSEADAYEAIISGDCGAFSEKMLKAFEKSRSAMEEAFSSF